MRRNTIGLTLATLTAAGVVGVTGAAFATADDSTESPTSSSTADTDSGAGSDSGVAPEGRPGGPGGHAHTEVTGDEAQKVIDAVTAEDSSVTVEKVLQDEDGSYDVVGTKDGSRVAYEVSADLATVTERAGGRGGKGGPGCDGDGPDGADTESGTDTSSDPTAANTATSV